MDRQVDQPQVGPFALQAVDGGLATMAAAVVDDPEHPPSRRKASTVMTCSTRRPNGWAGRLRKCLNKRVVHVVGG